MSTIASGATVLVREERAVPLVALRGAFLGGVRYETERDNGLTTLVARMLTRGTDALGAEEIQHLLDACSDGQRRDLLLQGGELIDLPSGMQHQFGDDDETVLALPAGQVVGGGFLLDVSEQVRSKRPPHIAIQAVGVVGGQEAIAWQHHPTEQQE